MTKWLPVLILLLFVFCSKSFSQSKSSGTLNGTVFSTDGMPASFVTIRLRRLQLQTSADVNGNFSFKQLPSANDTLVIIGIGFKSYKKPVLLKASQTVSLGIIQLEYTISQLEDIEVTGRIAHSYKSDYSFFGDKTETPLIDIPQSISTVTKEMIQDKMELTVKDAVAQVAGVNEYSGFDEYTIRGFRAENARDINGLRGYNTTYTSSMLVNIERVEVIKGPTATLYGNCDPGGTINLVTKKPLEYNESSIDIYAGSWDHSRFEGDVTGPLNKSKTLLYRFNAGYDNTNSFRDNYYARSYELAPSLTFKPSDDFHVNIDLSVSHINTVLDRGQPGFEGDSTLKSTPISLSLSQPGDCLHETDFASVVSASYKISPRLTFNTGYLNYITQQNVAEHGFNNYITPDSVSLYYSTWNYNTTTNTITNYFTYKCNSGKVSHQLLLGYDFVKSKVDLNQQYYELPDQFGEGSGIVGTFSLQHPQYINRPVSSYQLSDYDNDASDINDDIYHTQGVYVQDDISAGKWKLLLSLREEFYKGGEDDSADNLTEKVFLPRAGLVYELKPNITSYVTYNKGFDPFEASTELEIFNEPFKPVISELIEGGIKANFFKNNFSTSLALYQLTVENVAVNANIPSNPNLFVQQGQDRSRGIELEGTGNIMSNLSVAVSYAHNIAKVTESKVPSDVGTILENAPKDASNSFFKYTIVSGSLKGLGFIIGHSQVGMRNTLDQQIKLPGYCIFNAGLVYGYKHATIAFNVNNLTDRAYWEAAYNNISKWPGAPRNFMIRVGYQF